jgi:hypothetical protein
MMPGENAADYHAFVAGVRADIKPVGFLEQMWVGDIVNNAWEIARLRRVKAGFMAAIAHEGLTAVLYPLRDFSIGDDLIDRWARREPDALEEVDRILASGGLGVDAVIATAFAKHTAFFATIEGLIGAAEARRDRALHEIDRYRLGLGREVRRALSQVEEGEYRVIEPDKDNRNSGM